MGLLLRAERRPVKEAWFEEVKRYEADVLAKRS